jgi:DNA-binding response OmpR family regulator
MTGALVTTGSPVVLVIDGNRSPHDEFLAELSSEGFRIVLAETGEEGLGVFSSQCPDATVVSTDLPDLSFGAVLRLLHELGARTVIALSGSDDESEAVLALEMGAVDVLGRPARAQESAARIWAAIRTPASPPPGPQGHITQVEPSTRSHQVLTAGPVEVDLVRREVRVEGAKVDARPKEIALLELLVADAGRSISRGQLLKALWPEQPESIANGRLDVHVRRVRFLVEKDVSRPEHVITLRGYGHRFDP